MQTIATFSPAKQINLLDYQTSPLQLGSAQIPAAQYQQLRFVLDTTATNSVVVNGVSDPLTIPIAAMGRARAIQINALPVIKLRIAIAKERAKNAGSFHL